MCPPLEKQLERVLGCKDAKVQIVDERGRGGEGEMEGGGKDSICDFFFGGLFQLK